MLIYRLLLAAILTYILLKYILPKVLCTSFEMVLILAKFLKVCETKKSNRSRSVFVRMIYLFIWLLVWLVVLLLFLPTQVLTLIMRFGGFAGGEHLERSEK